MLRSRALTASVTKLDQPRNNMFSTSLPPLLPSLRIRRSLRKKGRKDKNRSQPTAPKPGPIIRQRFFSPPPPSRYRPRPPPPPIPPPPPPPLHRPWVFPFFCSPPPPPPPPIRRSLRKKGRKDKNRSQPTAPKPGPTIRQRFFSPPPPSRYRPRPSPTPIPTPPLPPLHRPWVFPIFCSPPPPPPPPSLLPPPVIY
nr:hypothetical protein [Tanacetum cinerariifolium]